MENKWVSRKLVAAAVGLLAVILANATGIDLTPEEQERITEAVMVIVGAYVGGQSLVDAIVAKRKSSGLQ